MDSNENWDLSHIPDGVLLSEAAKRRRKYGGGAKPVIRPCMFCGAELSAREMRSHSCLERKEFRNLIRKGLTEKTCERWLLIWSGDDVQTHPDQIEVCREFLRHCKRVKHPVMDSAALAVLILQWSGRPVTSVSVIWAAISEGLRAAPFAQSWGRPVARVNISRPSAYEVTNTVKFAPGSAQRIPPAITRPPAQNEILGALLEARGSK